MSTSEHDVEWYWYVLPGNANNSLKGRFILCCTNLLMLFDVSTDCVFVLFVCRVPANMSTQAPTFTQPLQSVVALEGSAATFEAQISGKTASRLNRLTCWTRPFVTVLSSTGSPVPEVSWFRDGQVLSTTTLPGIQILFSDGRAVLRIPAVTAAHSGRFSVRATNGAGQATSTAELLVTGESREAGTPVTWENTGKIHWSIFPFKSLNSGVPITYIVTGSYSIQAASTNIRERMVCSQTSTSRSDRPSFLKPWKCKSPRTTWFKSFISYTLPF